MRQLRGAALGAIALAGCSKAKPPVYLAGVTGGPPLRIGEVMELPPAVYDWDFPAKPGDSYHVWAGWPAGLLVVEVDAQQKGPPESDGDDDQYNWRVRTDAKSDGHSGYTATLQIPDGGDQGRIIVIPNRGPGHFGSDDQPILLRIDRG